MNKVRSENPKSMYIFGTFYRLINLVESLKIPYIQKSRITNDRKSKRPNYQNACNIVWKVYAEYRKSRKNQDRKSKKPNYQKKYLHPNH